MTKPPTTTTNNERKAATMNTETQTTTKNGKTKIPTMRNLDPEVPAVAAAPDPLRVKLRAIESEMNKTFAERDREIHGLLVATLSREHVLLLGPAGTAKSAMANTFCSALDGARFYQRLLTRFSDPSELFGPVSLDGLKNDRYRRVVTGQLPEAHVAFIDEIYKANSAVLNSLLTALNERAFDNDGGRVAIPLETVVAASNELPEGPELAALHDRFMLRYWTTYTKTPDAFRRLITGAEPSIQARMTLDELKQAQAAVDALPISETAIDELFKLREEVKSAAVVASDRRWRKAVRVLKASAWLEGSTEVTPESFPILAHVLWETVEQIPKLQQIVSKYTSAELAEAQEAADAVAELLNNLPPKGSEQYAQQLVSITKELKRAHKRITDLHSVCRGVQSKAKIAGIASDIEGKYKGLQADAREALGI
jgi:MoxR-like ATPase